MAFETIKLPTASVGNQTHIHLHRFGPSGGKKVYIQAGAGIVADSNPEKEYQETLNKLKR